MNTSDMEQNRQDVMTRLHRGGKKLSKTAVEKIRELDELLEELEINQRESAQLDLPVIDFPTVKLRGEIRKMIELIDAGVNLDHLQPEKFKLIERLG